LICFNKYLQNINLYNDMSEVVDCDMYFKTEGVPAKAKTSKITAKQHTEAKARQKQLATPER